MQHGQYVYRLKPKRSKTKRLIRFISLIFVIFLSLLFLYFAIQEKLTDSSFLSPLANPLVFSSLPLKDSLDHQNKLGNIINAILKNEAPNYGIVVMNLKTNESYSLNEHKLFESASLYKLWVMAAAFRLMEEGRFKKTDLISQKIEVLNEKFKIATESAELREGEITLSVDEALRQMITISDNYSALLLSEKIGLSNVASYLSLEGFNESKIGNGTGPPVTSAYDTALFLEKLYKNEKKGDKSAIEMLSFLKRQRLKTKLPKYLPKNTVIAHKTGELGQYSHDAGIIYQENGDYIIAILSKTEKILEANETIAKISQAVFDYFKNK